MNKKTLLTLASIGSFVTASLLAVATSLQVSAQTITDRYECYSDAIANNHIAVADAFERYTQAIVVERRTYGEAIRLIYYQGPLRETDKQKRAEALQTYKTAVANAKVVYTKERTESLVVYKDAITDCRNLGKNPSITLAINGPVAKEVDTTAKNEVIAFVSLSTDNASVNVNKLYTLVEFLNQDQPVSFRAKEAIETIVLKDTNSQTMYEGTYVFDPAAEEQGRAVYRFDNAVDDFSITGSKQYQLLYSLTNNGPQSASTGLRVHICATESSNKCTFGNKTELSYPMSVTNAETKKELAIVRPNTVISSNVHTIKRGTVSTANLAIAVEPLSQTDNAVANQKDINLLRLRARTSDSEDILLTGATFVVESGNMLNAQNYTLWVDTNGDQEVDKILESGVASLDRETVVFNQVIGGGFVVSKGNDAVFELHADVASSLQDVKTLQVQIAENGIAATNASNGENLPSDTITINRTDSTVFTFVKNGDLLITLDERLQSKQLLAGKVSDTVLRLNFEARNEDIVVNELPITIGTDNGETNTSIKRLLLYKDAEAEPFGIATAANCTNQKGSEVLCFKSNDPVFVVPESGDIDISIRADVARDTEGAISGQKYQFAINNSDARDLIATGWQSSNTLLENNGNGTLDGEVIIGSNGKSNGNTDIISATNVIVGSKITSITNANPAANNTAVPTGIAPAGQFKFTAAAHSNSEDGLNDVVLDEIVFTVTASNVQLNKDGFTFYNKSDSTNQIPCEASGTTGLITVRCKDLIEGYIDQGNGGCFEDDDGETFCSAGAALLVEVNTEINQDSSETFVLQTDIESVGANSVLQVSLTNFANDPYIPNGDVAESNLYWVDTDALTQERFNYVEYQDTVVHSTAYKSN